MCSSMGAPAHDGIACPASVVMAKQFSTYVCMLSSLTPDEEEDLEGNEPDRRL